MTFQYSRCDSSDNTSNESYYETESHIMSPRIQPLLGCSVSHSSSEKSPPSPTKPDEAFQAASPDYQSPTYASLLDPAWQRIGDIVEMLEQIRTTNSIHSTIGSDAVAEHMHITRAVISKALCDYVHSEWEYMIVEFSHIFDVLAREQSNGIADEVAREVRGFKKHMESMDISVKSMTAEVADSRGQISFVYDQLRAVRDEVAKMTDHYKHSCEDADNEPTEVAQELKMHCASRRMPDVATETANALIDIKECVVCIQRLITKLTADPELNRDPGDHKPARPILYAVELEHLAKALGEALDNSLARSEKNVSSRFEQLDAVIDSLRNEVIAMLAQVRTIVASVTDSTQERKESRVLRSQLNDKLEQLAALDTALSLSTEKLQQAERAKLRLRELAQRVPNLLVSNQSSEILELIGKDT